MDRALIVVDVQKDFLPGGALAVPDGDKIIPVVKELIKKFRAVVLTQDWHPEGHASFKEWPVHCVMGTEGAKFADELKEFFYERLAAYEGTGKIVYQNIKKGMDLEIDSYSAFLDNDRVTSTGLAEWLTKNNIQTIYVCGLATDVCVKHTVIDGVNHRFRTFFVTDACKPVTKEGGKEARKEMISKGAFPISLKEIMAED